MFRDILVILGDKGAAALLALSFAQRFDAHMTAVCVGRDPIADAITSAQTRYDLILDSRAEAEGAAADTLEKFAAQASEAAVKAHIIKASDPDRPGPRPLIQFARGFDLAIAEQPEPGQSAFAGGMIGDLLSGSGRPVLTAPYILKDAAPLDRVAIAWDAGASAARALGEAMPILKRANAVEIVTIVDGQAGRFFPSGVDVARHLARHEIDATFEEIAGEIDPANMLLSHIADSGANLLVTGGYGHSRLSETVLGGATRTLLESMTIPVFMSH